MNISDLVIGGKRVMTETTFDNLKVGDFFIKGDNLYMKVNYMYVHTRGIMNCVNMDDKTIHSMSIKQEVLRLG